jgi:hypothetical protein
MHRTKGHIHIKDKHAGGPWYIVVLIHASLDLKIACTTDQTGAAGCSTRKLLFPHCISSKSLTIY